jgi:hypothetical protein
LAGVKTPNVWYRTVHDAARDRVRGMSVDDASVMLHSRLENWPGIQWRI